MTPTLGTKLADGSIYLGMLPNGQHSAMAAEDLCKPCGWDEAVKRAKDADLELPNRHEGLMMWELYKQQPELFTFGDYKACWLSELYNTTAWAQWFDDGRQYSSYRLSAFSVRPARRAKSFDDLIIKQSESEI